MSRVTQCRTWQSQNVNLDILPPESERSPSGFLSLACCPQTRSILLADDMVLYHIILGEDSPEWVFDFKINSWHLLCPQFTGEPNTKIVKGIVTSCGNDYGWIEDCVFFSTDVVIGPLPLQAGDKVLAFVEEDPLSHDLKATEVSFAYVWEDSFPIGLSTLVLPFNLT